ncbi:MAG: hypothetical protein MHM6MM_008376 [Cercozoa sp. M6MM]
MQQLGEGSQTGSYLSLQFIQKRYPSDTFLPVRRVLFEAVCQVQRKRSRRRGPRDANSPLSQVEYSISFNIKEPYFDELKASPRSSLFRTEKHRVDAELDESSLSTRMQQLRAIGKRSIPLRSRTTHTDRSSRRRLMRHVATVRVTVTVTVIVSGRTTVRRNRSNAPIALAKTKTKAAFNRHPSTLR